VHSLASIPSPTHAVWHVGPIPIRAYALCIVAGIFVALAVTVRRWRARGGKDEDVWDVAGWAIAFGIIGGRLYHVVTDGEKYFGTGKHPVDALKIWDGGLGIWGAIALGALGAWIGCRRKGMRLTAFADAAAPGVVAAQGIGRWGNWFNNELYGRPTDVAWKLQIHCLDITTGRAQVGGFASGDQPCPPGSSVAGYFQPTFLYESLWDIALAFLLIWAARRWRLGRGNLFALYAMGYTAGRFYIEGLRSDFAHHFLGLRLNEWTSVVVFVGALLWFVRHRNTSDESPYRHPPAEGGDTAEAADTTEPAEPTEPTEAAAEAEPGEAEQAEAEAEPADEHAEAEPADEHAEAEPADEHAEAQSDS
jgi:prolipoprotein diacylglyceryl transferase